MRDTTANLVPISLAILTFTKDTNRSTDKPTKKYQLYKYINRFTFLGETPEVIPQPPQYSDLGIKYLD